MEFRSILDAWLEKVGESSRDASVFTVVVVWIQAAGGELPLVPSGSSITRSNENGLFNLKRA